MNFVPGKMSVSLDPVDDMPDSTSSTPNFSPLLPRPCSKINVCVCADVGWTTNGCGGAVREAPGDFSIVSLLSVVRDSRRISYEVGASVQQAPPFKPIALYNSKWWCSSC